MKNQRGFVWLPALLIILGIVVVGGGAYLYSQTYQSAAPTNDSMVASSTTQAKGTPAATKTIPQQLDIEHP